MRRANREYVPREIGGETKTEDMAGRAYIAADQWRIQEGGREGPRPPPLAQVRFYQFNSAAVPKLFRIR